MFFCIKFVNKGKLLMSRIERKKQASEEIKSEDNAEKKNNNADDVNDTDPVSYTHLIRRSYKSRIALKYTL